MKSKMNELNAVHKYHTWMTLSAYGITYRHGMENNIQMGQKDRERESKKENMQVIYDGLSNKNERNEMKRKL